MSNKDDGEQSAVSQIWGGKQDEEEDVSPGTAHIKMKYTNLSCLFFNLLGLEKVKVAFDPLGVQLWVTCRVWTVRGNSRNHNTRVL